MRLFALGLVLLGTASWAAMPQSKHIWIITEENHSYEAVIGNSNMPKKACATCTNSGE